MTVEYSYSVLIAQRILSISTDRHDSQTPATEYSSESQIVPAAEIERNELFLPTKMHATRHSYIGRAAARARV